MKKNVSVLIMVAGVILSTGFAHNAALADLVTGDPSLPPTDGEYISPETYGPHFIGAGLEVLLEAIVFQPLAVPAPQLTDVGADEQQYFQSTLTAMAHVTPLAPQAVSFAGPVTWMAYGKVGNTTGTFDVEFVDMWLTGNVDVPGFGIVPIILRESPTAQSLGETTITDLGGGLYHIDSFFDVFAEASPDGGTSWIAAEDSVHIVLVPEPATLGLLLLGGLALLRRKGRA